MKQSKNLYSAEEQNQKYKNKILNSQCKAKNLFGIQHIFVERLSLQHTFIILRYILTKHIKSPKYMFINNS